MTNINVGISDCESTMTSDTNTFEAAPSVPSDTNTWRRPSGLQSDRNTVRPASNVDEPEMCVSTQTLGHESDVSSLRRFSSVSSYMNTPRREPERKSNVQELKRADGVPDDMNFLAEASGRESAMNIQCQATGMITICLP